MTQAAVQTAHAADDITRAGGLLNHKAWLAGELIAIFFGLPGLVALLFANGIWPFAGEFLGLPRDTANLPIPKWDAILLYSWGAAGFVLLLVSRTFDRGAFFGFKRTKPLDYALIGVAVTLACVGLMAFMAVLQGPSRVFWLGRAFGIGVLFFLPFYGGLFVYPQEVVFRGFFFHRYRPLLKHDAIIIALSALAFGWMHVIYLNWVAIALCVVGGVAMGITYARTKSLWAVTLEHAIVGWLAFIVGFGPNFYLPASMRGVYGPEAFADIMTPPNSAPANAESTPPADPAPPESTGQ